MDSTYIKTNKAGLTKLIDFMHGDENFIEVVAGRRGVGPVFTLYSLEYLGSSRDPRDIIYRIGIMRKMRNISLEQVGRLTSLKEKISL